MSDLALSRLAEERKSWRKDHPIGFFARPQAGADGVANMMIWDCGIPGKDGTPWEGGLYPLTLKFPKEYPVKAPLCLLPPGFFHVNVFDNGQICLSIIGDGWKPTISIKQICLGVQDLLDNPNPNSPANSSAYDSFKKNKAAYTEKVKQQAKKFPPQES
ncbi:hypothetical protein DFA_11554 [Cavenderia fasciculata]|uniref:UBC core domain-containing protein n=1 Tax=Cavenderia fasciculata TaxID=261658 RepID=F4QDJ6_CACFS|nr:uncharacterized protein DFA_11554 [Cavenderia fasciculata]EGG13793.1 hypothetical protein DFA_11554 [Cavenderia fasciculata]|eukprot:XP_004350501.1 hypothetical protein DFA_11554 [Cavenderia fasciculata]